MKARLLAIILVVALLAAFAPAQETQQVEAQGSATNLVLLNFSNYVGISPPLTSAELELGELNRPFTAAYEFAGLDLRDGPLSCDSRVMEDDEFINDGRIGWRYLITLQGRVYEFRSNFGGSQIIRCYFEEQIDFNGNPRGIGNTITDEQATNAAMAHAQNFLGYDTIISVERANDPVDETPLTYYVWRPFVYLDASLLCPAAGFTYDVRDTFAFRVQLTIAGRYLDYRVRGDGNVVLLCQGGRPNETSIGLTIDRFGDTTE